MNKTQKKILGYLKTQKKPIDYYQLIAAGIASLNTLDKNFSKLVDAGHVVIVDTDTGAKIKVWTP